MNFQILISIAIAIIVSVGTYIILKRFLYPKVFQNVIVKKDLVENDILERYEESDLEDAEDLVEIQNITEGKFKLQIANDSKVEILDPFLRKAFEEQHRKFIDKENNISESEIDQQGLIKFKNTNAEKIKLLSDSEEKRKESLARIQKSNYGNS